MSRQKGSRQRPVAERRRYHDQFTRRRRGRVAPAAVTGEPITRRRCWGAALGGTIVLVFAFAAVVTAIVEQDRGNPRRAAAAAIAAAALVPVVFTVLARVSRAPRPMRAVLLATPLAIAGYLGVGSLVREPTSSLVLAFGIAGAFVLRAEPVHRIPLRITVVGVSSLVTLLLSVVAPVGAVVIAPFLPFPALVVADIVAEARPTT